ncbi:class I histocompatibility antigen, F10 alpha chain-like [Pristis pectinata]|uniref:class I histocompatibility antigen, F10 alpha chain-like n=1 Tax=Pristis pectinata TaxID=685728 RepID=UPI00223E3EE4|nr:class I histocompatibility antigen, F10 alpha chain-like [Pristis pectinata]
MFLFMLLSFLRVQGALPDSHSLIYYYTLNHGTSDLPEFIIVGVLDGCEIVYYDKNMEILALRQERLASFFHMTQRERDTKLQNELHGIVKEEVNGWLLQLNETENYHYIQAQFGCEVNDPSPNRRILKVAFDGRYAFSFDADKLEWTVHDPVAQSSKAKWDQDVTTNNYFKTLLATQCVVLRILYSIVKSYLTRKVPPEVYVTARAGEHWFLHCNVFGFYPTAINVSWFRNGHRVSETKSTGILPNEDGTYQLRSVLEFDPFDGKKYSCHIDHSSLPDGKTVIWEGNRKNDKHVVLIAVLVPITLVITLAVIIWWRKYR